MELSKVTLDTLERIFKLRNISNINVEWIKLLEKRLSDLIGKGAEQSMDEIKLVVFACMLDDLQSTWGLNSWQGSYDQKREDELAIANTAKLIATLKHPYALWKRSKAEDNAKIELRVNLKKYHYKK